MRLKCSSASARERLVLLVNEGYSVLNEVRDKYQKAKTAGTYDDQRDPKVYGSEFETWAQKVVEDLVAIFPTELEANKFVHPDMPFGAVSGDYNYASLTGRFVFFLMLAVA